MNDLIRQAIAAEAEERVDSRTVLAELHKRKKSRKPFGLIVGVATLTVAAAAAAFIVPLALKKTDASPANAPTNAPAPAVSAQNVLLIGTDDERNADAIVFVRFEADGSAAVISLPRNIFVGSSTDGLYSLYRENPRKLTTAVENLTGTKVDHYAAIQMSAFGRVATAVGGVEVCLNNATRDNNTGARFEAGKQVLTGDQALLFLRQRVYLRNGDLDRVRRQQAFLSSLATKIDKDKAVALVEQVSKSIQIDEGWDLLQFATRFKGPIKIRTATLPVGEAVERADRSGFVADPAQAKQFVEKQFAGEGPAQTGCVD